MCDNIANMKKLIKALMIESRFSIYLYLLIYNELTLDRLATLMNKSKSTIHHHISELISLDLIEEYVKPGSKTRYYKLKLLRTDEVTEMTYSKESFKDMTQPEKFRHLEEYFNFGDMLARVTQNMFNLVLDQHAFLLSDVKQKKFTAEEALEKSESILLGTYLSSEKYGKEFQEELIQLIKKYYKKEVDNPDQERPRAFVLLGLDLMEILNKKYMT
jgi:predicted transcriptional regulator